MHGLGENSLCDQVNLGIPSNEGFQPSFNLSHPQDGSAEVLPDIGAREGLDKGDGEADRMEFEGGGLIPPSN